MPVLEYGAGSVLLPHSKSVPGFAVEDEASSNSSNAGSDDTNNIFERQVESDGVVSPTSEGEDTSMPVGFKPIEASESNSASMTLPTAYSNGKSKSSTTTKGLNSTKRTSSLKRSITLPKNPFNGSDRRVVKVKHIKQQQQQQSACSKATSEPAATSGGEKGKDSSSTNTTAAPPRTQENDDPSSAVEVVSSSAVVEPPPEPSSSRLASAAKAKSDSVKSFLSKMVNHISVSTVVGRSRSKHNAACDLDERIREWRTYFDGRSKVPGVIGIRNHGNTCFINSILQCLSYTDILAEYFCLDQYKSDLKRRRRLTAFTSKATATGKGEITEQLATLLKSLWSLQYDPEISDKFKALVDKYGSQYKGGSQHDAQEFLLWLLDKVHEELNTATKKKYKRLKNIPGRPDDILAAESLANYMRCNNSFVVDIFQAQFRSSLTCPSCERQSNTFDPFLCVSLPIPQKQVRPIVVTVLYIDQSPRQVRIGLTLPVDADVRELRAVLAKDTGIPESLLLLTEIDQLCFQKTFCDGQPLSVVGPDSPLYAIEVPRPASRQSLAADVDENNGAFVVLTWLNVFKEGLIEKRFGSPYTIQVSRETPYGDLQKLLMKEMSPILHDDILISAQKVPLFRIRVLDSFDDDGKTYLDERMELPLYMDCVETALNVAQVQQQQVHEVTGGEGGGPPVHVKLVLEWDMPAKTQIIADDSDPVEEHYSVRQVKEAPEEGSVVTLQECFSLYTSEEKLSKEDAYFCPQCNKKREVVKKLGVWSVPDVLVVHLKRFRQSTNATNKLETLVDFPIESFDMSPNMARPVDPVGPPPATSSSSAAATTAADPAADNGGQQQSNTTTSSSSAAASAGLKVISAFSPWKHPKRLRTTLAGATGDKAAVETLYDLYSVCNHHGSDLQGGHYTAICKNPTDGQWYSFDDMVTKQVTEADVITKDAYILFYQKSCLSPTNSSATSSASSSCSGSSSSGSSSSSSGASSQEHWVYRMPDFYFKAKNETRCAPTAKPRKDTAGGGGGGGNKKRVNLLTGGRTAVGTTKSAGGGGNFNRNSSKYATMPVRRTTEVITTETEHNSDTEQGNRGEESSDDEEEEGGGGGGGNNYQV